MFFGAKKFVLFLVLAAVGWGQAPTGTIAGVVMDQSRASIAGAKVTITNPETALHRLLLTTSQGTYSASALPAGAYQVRAEAPGFVAVVRDAEAVAGMTTTVDFSLAVG